MLIKDLDGSHPINQERINGGLALSHAEQLRPFTLFRDTFHILVALADQDRHGYSIMQEIKERTAGHVRLSPSTLYSAIKRLLEQGLIAELEERPGPEHDDERRRYYRLTPAGGRAAMAEAAQLEKLLAPGLPAWHLRVGELWRRPAPRKCES